MKYFLNPNYGIDFTKCGSEIVVIMKKVTITCFIQNIYSAVILENMVNNFFPKVSRLIMVDIGLN